MPNWVYEISTLNILDVNDCAIKHYGYTKEEFLNMTILDLRPAGDISGILSSVHSKKDRDGNINFGIHTHVKKNGEIIRVEINGHKVHFQGKDCMMITVQDVTKEEAKIELNREVQNLVDASLDVICSIDEQGRFIHVGAASLTHWGYTPEELKGKSYMELVHPDDVVITEQAANEIIAGGEFTTFENRYIRKNGDVAFNIWSARWDASSKTMYCVARDAEEKRKKEVYITESESRFKALVQEGSDLIAIIDEAGNYSYVSPTSSNVLGIAPEEFIGRNAFEFIHPDDVERTLQSMAKLASQNTVAVEPFRFQNKEGVWRWVETILTNRIDHPSIRGIVANSRDITALKEEEQRLKLYEKVVQTTTEPVIITEAEPQQEPGPRIVYVNEAFTKMTGYSAEEIVGKSPRFLQGPKSDREALAKMSKAMRNWETSEITTINYKKNGEEFWVNFKISPVANEKGWYTHWVSIERDITELKNQEIQKALLAKISLAFNENVVLNSSLEQLCRLIIEYGNFNVCEVWIPTVQNKQLKLVSRCTLNTEADGFYECSKDFEVLEMNEGLPGKVWKNKKSVLWDDIATHESFLRKEAARKIKLNSVLGLPLVHKEKIVGVLMVGSTETAVKIKNHQPILTKLQSFIGSEINRKRLEGELQHLFEALPDLICLSDFNGKFLKINKAGCDMLGYKEEEIIGKSFEYFLHPEDRIHSFANLELLSKGENVVKFENRFITKTGQIIWLSWNSISNIKEGVIYSSAKNTTEEHHLKDLVDDATSLALIGGWEIDVINEKMYWSDMVHQIHETDPATFTPQLTPSIQFYKEEYTELITAQLTNSATTGEPFDFEASMVSAKGNEKWVRAIGQAEVVDGKCIRVYGSLQDITNFKTTKQRLETIINDLPGVTFQYYMYPDGTDKMTAVSKASYKIWGLSPEQCENDTNLVWEPIKRGGDYEETMKSIKFSIKNDTQWQARFRIITDNGEVRYHEGFGSPHKLPDGTVLFNSMVFDITEEKRAIILHEVSSKLALIGSWELNLKSQTGETMYWSPVLRQIMEVDDDFVPTLSGGLEFYDKESRAKIENAVQQLIETKTPFDLELLVRTAKNKNKWVRCIGEGDFIGDECIRIFGSYQDINDLKLAKLNFEKAYLEKNKIIESIGDAFFTINRDFVVTYWNAVAEKLLGVSREQIVGKNLWEVFPDAVDLPSYANYNRALKDGTAVKFEDYYGIWLEVDAYPSEEGLTVFFRDITERKEASEKLSKAYEERNEILESIGDAFFAVDNNWVVTYWNRMAEEVLFRTKEEILGKNLWEVYADAIDSDFYRKYHEAKENGLVVSFEEHYPALNKWFEVTAYPSEKGLSVYFRDITLRKETDIRILRANERFEKVTQATTDAIWDWDIENDSFYRGQRFENIFGKEVLLNMKEKDFWKDSFHQDDFPEVRESIYVAIQDPSVTHWEKEYRVVHSSGKIKTVLDKGIIIRNAEGKAIRMVGAITDITFRKEYEMELQTLNSDLKKNVKELLLANEELEQFAFIASHDLQEPLRMITGFMDQLKRKYADQLDEKGNQYIFFAIDGAKRMKKIILDLLEYSRAGRTDASKELVDLTNLIEDYKSLRRKVISEKSVEIITDELPIVNAHLAPMTQTLHSLLDNAIKYSKPNEAPKIEIKIIEEDKQWVFAVKDKGIGIDNRFLDKIFIIFQRLHDRDQFEGTGIGLALVKKNVESWGGKVWVDSEVNKGSTFWFTLPK